MMNAEQGRTVHHFQVFGMTQPGPQVMQSEQSTPWAMDAVVKGSLPSRKAIRHIGINTKEKIATGIAGI